MTRPQPETHYKKGTVLKLIGPNQYTFGPGLIERGDVAIIEKVEVYETMCPPDKQLHISYDLLILRTRELVRGVPAYQVAVYWVAVDA